MFTEKRLFFQSTARYHEPYYVEVELKDDNLKVCKQIFTAIK